MTFLYQCSMPNCFRVPAQVERIQGRYWCSDHAPDVSGDDGKLVTELREMLLSQERISEQHRKQVQKVAAERDEAVAAASQLHDQLAIERAENAAFRAFISTRGMSGAFEASEQRLRMLEGRL